MQMEKYNWYFMRTWGLKADVWLPVYCKGVKNCFVFEFICSSAPKVPPFRIPVQASPGKLFTGYRPGDPIMTEDDEYFTIPQVIASYLGASDSSWPVWNSPFITFFCICSQIL